MGSTRSRVLAVFADGVPRSCRMVIRETGLRRGVVYSGVARAWRAGVLMRTVEPFQEYERINDGRAGARRRIVFPISLVP